MQKYYLSSKYELQIKKKAEANKMYYLIVIFAEVVQEADKVKGRFQEELTARNKWIQTAQMEVVCKRVQVKKNLEVEHDYIYKFKRIK